jgi:hypothetical protein
MEKRVICPPMIAILNQQSTGNRHHAGQTLAKIDLRIAFGGWIIQNGKFGIDR